MNAIRVLINGARGRMGKAVAACAAELPEIAISAQIDAGDDFAGAVAECDVVIDFSHHSALELVLARCTEHHRTLVIGTTGHNDVQIAGIQHAAKVIPLVYAPNFSIGVNTLFWLTKKAAEILGPSFDLEVVEMHHRLKKDAPSGTAKRLAEILANVRKLSYQ
jgi:4-hydroxy-tetrahydrodipicolinate reductase